MPSKTPSFWASGDRKAIRAPGEGDKAIATGRPFNSGLRMCSRVIGNKGV